jgi:hypothetical protein
MIEFIQIIEIWFKEFMTNDGMKKLQVLYSEYQTDVSLQQFMLEEKTMLAPTYVAKWIMQYAEHKSELGDMEDRYDLLKGNEEAVIRKSLKIDASDADIKKLRLKYDSQLNDLATKISDHKEIVRVLGELKSAMGFFRNDVKNALDYRKLEGV